MLVFMSDIHLTDGSSGDTIKPTAFRVFAENLRKLADSVSPLEEIRLVLLGDIFDIIRSTEWNAAGVSVRPWDPAGPVQGAVVERILQGIITNNQRSLNELVALQVLCARKKRSFRHHLCHRQSRLAHQPLLRLPESGSGRPGNCRRQRIPSPPNCSSRVTRSLPATATFMTTSITWGIAMIPQSATPSSSNCSTSIRKRRPAKPFAVFIEPGGAPKAFKPQENK